MGKRRSVWRWVALAAAGGVALFIGLDAFQGKLLGVLSGTTVDPRSALGARPRSLSMERQVFTFNDTVARRAYNAKKGIETPEIKLAIPKAYINVVRSEKDGWFGTNVHGVGLTISSQNFKPYRLEHPKVRKEVLDHLGIKLVKRSERYPPRPGLPSLGNPNELIFPSNEAKARYDAEMLRRGFTEIDAGVGNGAHVTAERRAKALLSFPFRKAVSLKKSEALEGCVTRPGPYPNSVRYDHSPEALAHEAPTSLRIRTSCIRTVHQRRSFVVVQYDDNGELAMTIVCRDHHNKTCHAKSYWREIWGAKLGVSNKYLSRIPEFIEKLKALFDSFEAAARGQS